MRQEHLEVGTAEADAGLSQLFAQRGRRRVRPPAGVDVQYGCPGCLIRQRECQLAIKPAPSLAFLQCLAYLFIKTLGSSHNPSGAAGCRNAHPEQAAETPVQYQFLGPISRFLLCSFFPPPGLFAQLSTRSRQVIQFLLGTYRYASIQCVLQAHLQEAAKVTRAWRSKTKDCTSTSLSTSPKTQKRQVPGQAGFNEERAVHHTFPLQHSVSTSQGLDLKHGVAKKSQGWNQGRDMGRPVQRDSGQACTTGLHSKDLFKKDGEEPARAAQGGVQCVDAVGSPDDDYLAT